MTLSEVVVASLVLAISSQVSVQGWSTSARSVAVGDSLQQTLQRTDQRFLAVRRILQHADPTELLMNDGSCRLDPRAVFAGIAAALPPDPQLQQHWSADEKGAGLWLELSKSSSDGVPSLQRRQLFTAAGLGLCFALEAS